MVKIAFIGAGSRGFSRTLITDILSFPALRTNTIIALMDINETRLNYNLKMLNLYKENNPKELENVTFEATTDQKKAITDATYIVSAFMVGGWPAFKADLDIPFKYGVTQNVGDSLGPGGVFRFLRNVPVYRQLIENMKDVGLQSARHPLHLNYTNPMAMNTWFCNVLWQDSTVGLCHGVQYTSNQLRLAVGAAPDEFSFLCAGINHMGWFLDIRYKDASDPNAKWVDAYPILWEHRKEDPQIEGSDKVRWDMMRATGYFMTETSGHLSDFLPYYRKRQYLLEKYKGADSGFDSLLHGWDMENVKVASEEVDEAARSTEPPVLPWKKATSVEYVCNIINAMETDVPFRFNGNIMNKGQGLITNLPRDCCIEVPVFADAHGLHPQGGIELPTVCQALCASNIMVQKAAVEGAFAMDKEKIYHALLLDPNTASVCSPEEIRAMTKEMFEAEKQWLGYWD